MKLRSSRDERSAVSSASSPAPITNASVQRCNAIGGSFRYAKQPHHAARLLDWGFFGLLQGVTDEIGILLHDPSDQIFRTLAGWLRFAPQLEVLWPVVGLDAVLVVNVLKRLKGASQMRLH